MSVTGRRRQNHSTSTSKILSLTAPLHAPLLFFNEQSEVRDFCANERTFLSWLRLATYLAIVSIALLVSFHLKRIPTEQEQRIGLPLGVVFWVLSLGTLGCGVASYIRIVEGYGRRKALVQSGWVTQIVSSLLPLARNNRQRVCASTFTQPNPIQQKRLHQVLFLRWADGRLSAIQIPHIKIK